MIRINTTLLLVLTVGAASAACDPPKKQPEPEKKSQPAVKKKSPAMGLSGAFKPPLPEDYPNPENPFTEEKIALGRKLYFDERLSKNHDISCNTCHQLDKYGVDGEVTSPGHKKQLGVRNSPTVYNAAAHFVQFWDGRSPNVEHQATQPVLNPVEMAMPDETTVLKVLSSIPEYVEAFKEVFPDSETITLENVGKAIGAFERKLVTPAPWDDFLKGKESALSETEKEGFVAFMQAGCNACHMGTQLGGTMYQKVGLIKAWPNQEDQGRYEVTKQESDKMMFKVPGLRNVEKTAPYFHDGSAATLEEAVKMMAEHQIARPVSEEEQKKIVSFLHSLTGQLPSEELIGRPELPESTDETPAPDPT